MTTTHEAPKIDGRIRQVTGKWGARYYESPEGQRYPSVTTILGVLGKPALVPWAAKVEREAVVEAAANLYVDAPPEKMSRPSYIATLLDRVGKLKAYQKQSAKALEIGSQAHKLVEWNIRKELGQAPGPEPEIGPDALVAFAAYEEWRKSVNLVPIWSEQVVYHPIERYAGTMDLFAMANLRGKAERGIVDFKTSKAIYPEALIQVAAYAKAVEAMGHGAVDVAWIVRLPKAQNDPGFEVVTIEGLEDLYQVFLNLKAVYNWQLSAGASRDGSAAKDGASAE
jgi:hypothetical protein